MIQAKELRVGNLVTWNPKLANPNNTLPPLQLEVFAILQDKISYVFPNIENRVEPFEDDVAQMGVKYKPYNEIEGIELNNEVLENCGFKLKGGLLSSKHFELDKIQLKQSGECFLLDGFEQEVKYFHQLQNLYFVLIGCELEIKLHGQQA